MTAVGPGDFLEAKHDTPAMLGFIATFAGGIYTIACFDEPAQCVDCGDEGPALYLVGDPIHPEFGRCLCEFKPMRRPRDQTLPDRLNRVPSWRRVEA